MNRTATVLRGLLALVVLVGLVVGLPLALVAVAGSPIPDSVPDPAQLWDTLTSRDDGTVLLVLLRAAAWFGWALFTVSVLADVVSRARRVPVPRLGPQQAFASHLVAAVAALAIAAPTAAAAAPVQSGPAGTAEGSSTVSTQTHSPTSSAWAGLTARLDAADTAARTSAKRPTERAAPGAGQHQSKHRWEDYRVTRDDTLWDIADRELGDPYRWPELYGATLTVEQPAGQRLTDPDLILPGWTVRVPRVIEATPADPGHVAPPASTEGAEDASPADPDERLRTPLTGVGSGNRAAGVRLDQAPPGGPQPTVRTALSTPASDAPAPAPSRPWRDEIRAALAELT
jgi:hypothetical protein